MSKKLLIMLVALVAGAFMASVAMAIDYGTLAYTTRVAGKNAGTILNPEGKGDTLLAAYYDVRVLGGKTQDTYFAIINENMNATTWGGVAAKLRFREWDKSEEVFDIDIWLSTDDVWVGVLTRDTSSGLTKITSPDYVITDFTGSNLTVSRATLVSSGFAFITDFVPGGAYNRVSPPSGVTSADLTNMGYFEIIGEEQTYSKPSTTTAPILVTRLSGVLADCPNSLSAYVYVVRVADGVSVGYNADAIANFSRNQGSLFFSPGNLAPALNLCEDGLDQLEFELSKARVYHGYSVEDTIAGKFSLIVTLPTKHFHFEKHAPIRLDYTICSTTGPFCYSIGAPFVGGTANLGETIGPHIFNRDEQSQAVGYWSPVTTIINLPWEVNVIGLYSGSPPSVPLAGNRDNAAWSTGGYQTGWVWIDLYASAHFAAPRSAARFGHLGNSFLTGYNGLPALSLALQEFSNGNVGGAYGVIFPAFYRLDWLP